MYDSILVAPARKPRRRIPPRQLAALQVVAAYNTKNGRPPTYRNITAGLGLTGVNGAVAHVNQLIGRGLLRTATKTARGITVTAMGNLVLAGWRMGPPALEGIDLALKIDGEAAGRMRCGECKRRGLRLVPMNCAGIYGGVTLCDRCGFQEEA